MSFPTIGLLIIVTFFTVWVLVLLNRIQRLKNEHNVNTFAKVQWHTADIETKRPDWSEAQCLLFAEYAEKQMMSDMVERGWDSMDTLLSMYEVEQPTGEIPAKPDVKLTAFESFVKIDQAGYQLHIIATDPRHLKLGDFVWVKLTPGDDWKLITIFRAEDNCFLGHYGALVWCPKCAGHIADDDCICYTKPAIAEPLAIIGQGDSARTINP